MRFADLILPLPLPGKFTYSVPEDMQSRVDIGMRVYVQFGRKKFYTAIIDSLHDNAPSGYEVKPLIALLDEKPIVRYPQRRLWEWLADYYLCTIGDVYKAALPASLRIESETYVSVSREYDPEKDVALNSRDAEVLSLLEAKGRMRLEEVGRTLDVKGIGASVSRLVQRGLLSVDEKAVDRYRAHKEKCIRLTIKRMDNEGLHSLFDKVTRSARQQKALVGYLDLSAWMKQNEPLRHVSRKDLMEHTGVTAGIIRNMVDKQVFEEYTRTINRFDGKENPEMSHTLAQLSDIQNIALNEIRDSMIKNAVTLLHGVTGGGKTEIYTHLMSETIRAGRQVLYLVPEISLTTQLTDRLRRVFGDSLLVYHSKFTDSERADIWKRVLESKEPLVVLGVRSSVFLPFYQLGLVIVDEEHESSYKQYDPAPRYNARDTAIVLAGMHGAKTLLGSATPAVDSYYKGLHGKYGLVKLTERFEGAVLPDVQIVDMKSERKRKTNHGILSSHLIENMKLSLEHGRQGIMFQNRRGFAPYVVCKECGWTPKCVNCDVSLVYHKNSNQLRCHYCGYSLVPQSVCPACGLNGIEVYGYGTERIAEELHREFEGYRVARMDLDTTRNKDSYQEIIEEFSRQETDILVGTQMVTKGLDFDKVSVVGVLNADTLLNFPDFRSSERAFNMLEQVSGRAGRRKEHSGNVIIQTTAPESSVLQKVKNHDYEGFYEEEIEERRKYLYPPYSRIINIYLKNKDSRTVDSLAVSYALALREIFGERVLGPEKPYVGRISNWYLQCIMLKIESRASLKKVKGILREVYLRFASDPRMKSSQLHYDVDPV